MFFVTRGIVLYLGRTVTVWLKLANSKKNQHPKNMKCPSTVSWNEVYDVIAGIISFTDLATDVMVIYGYYTKGRTAFFGVSLVIVILAQLLYGFWFTMRYGDNKNKVTQLWIFFLVLPISPFISFIFCCTTKSDTCCAKMLRCMTLSVDDWHIPNDVSPLRQWFHRKFAKHFIFIMEAICESFPNSIIQLIAIVYYNDKIDLENDIFSVINIISIIISMLSVGSKSLVLSALMGGIENHTFIYNWLSNILGTVYISCLFCCFEYFETKRWVASLFRCVSFGLFVIVFFCNLTDFFGIFFVVSWVFYRPNDNNNDLTSLGYFYVYKSLISTLPAIILIGFGLCGKLFFHFYEKWVSPGDYICNILIGICWFIPVFTLFIGGCIVSFMLCEIALFSYCSLLIYLECVKRRFKHSNAKQIKFWQTLFKWVDNSKSLLSTKFQYNDAIVRISIINDILYNHPYILAIRRKDDNGEKLIKYLESKQDYPQCFETVKLSEIRNISKDYNVPSNNPHNKHDAKFWKRIISLLLTPYNNNNDPAWDDFEEITAFIVVLLVTFIFFPLYCVSRVITLFFPIIVCVVYLFGENSVLNNNINDDGESSSLPYFQIFMTIVYVFLLIIWLIYSIFFVWKKQYYRWHIVPFQIKIDLYSTSTGFKYDADFLLKTRIIPYYQNMRFSQSNKELICHCLGNDIGSIVNSYLPQFTTDIKKIILTANDNHIEQQLKDAGILWDDKQGSDSQV